MLKIEEINVASRELSLGELVRVRVREDSGLGGFNHAHPKDVLKVPGLSHEEELKARHNKEGKFIILK